MAGGAIACTSPNAAQVSSMLCEMYSSRAAGVLAGPRGGGTAAATPTNGGLAQCFSEGVRISRLRTGSVVARGRPKVVAALSAAPPGQAQACVTVHMAAAAVAPPSTPSLALAFFARGQAPGFNSRGLAKATDACANPGATAMLMRSTAGRIEHVFVSEDDYDGGFGSDGRCMRGDLEALSLWDDVLLVAQDSFVSAAGGTAELTCYISHSADEGGPVMSDRSACESWQISLQRPTDHYFAQPKSERA
jgi:hypothetical protein